MFLLDTIAKAEPDNATVVVMGLGIVFIGLIIIIFVCKIMGLIMGSTKSASPDKASVAAPVQTATANEPIEDKGELIAAISTAVAESLGKDVKAIRIKSIKRV